MIPDIKTLMMIYVIINIVGFGAIAIVWSQNRKRFAGISFWLADMALQAAGSLLILMRGLIGDFISIVIANIIIQTGIIFILMGLERFAGKKSRQIHNYILLAIFAFLITYYSFVQPSLEMREIILSVTIVIFTFQCCWLLLGRVAPSMRQITRTTGILFGGYVIVNFARIILLLVSPAQSNDFFKSSVSGSLAIILYITLSACLTISLILMVSKRLLEEVKTQEEKFTRAFHSSPYAITITRPSDGKIVEINDGFVDISGYQYSEVIGKTTADLNLWVSEADRMAVVSDLLKHNKVRGLEFQFRRKSGEIITGLFSADITTIDNEKYILSSINDITEQARAAQEINRLNAELEKRVIERTSQLKATNKELEAFVYSISHDLRAPLRGIDGWSHALLEDYKEKLDETGQKYLNLVRSETQRMGKLIDGLLVFSRQSRSEMKQMQVDMTAMVQTIISQLQQQNPAIQAEFVIQPELTAQGDSNLLEIALGNLLDNAVKFSSKNAHPLIEFGETEKDGSKAFFVHDNGVGFDMEYANKLFGMFQRLHKSSEFPGTGIGLASVQRIINRHGGRIWADAQANTGATFYFTLKEAA